MECLLACEVSNRAASVNLRLQHPARPPVLTLAPAMALVLVPPPPPQCLTKPLLHQHQHLHLHLHQRLQPPPPLLLFLLQRLPPRLQPQAPEPTRLL